MAEFKSWMGYWNFSRSVKTQSRYVRSVETECFLQAVRDTWSGRKLTLSRDEKIWRAQVGFDWEIRREGPNEYEIEAPYSAERMKPKVNVAVDGRANPKGIVCLYLSTDKETAMAEVRPWLGSYVSLAQLRICRDLELIDCSVGHDLSKRLYFKEPSKADREKAVWTHIDQAFSEPVSHGDISVEYVPTQILSELFRQGGFDGIRYKSRLSKNGFNIALFDTSAADVINCTLYKVEDVSFRFEQAGNTYFVNKK